MSRDRLDYYEILQVTPQASSDVIKAAHRALVKKMHPDAGGTHAHVIAINEAAEVLLDPVRRAQYDREIKTKTPSWNATRRPDGPNRRDANFIVDCWNCGTRNRLKSRRGDDEAKCGNCGVDLAQLREETSSSNRQQEGPGPEAATGTGAGGQESPAPGAPKPRARKRRSILLRGLAASIIVGVGFTIYWHIAPDDEPATLPINEAQVIGENATPTPMCHMAEVDAAGAHTGDAAPNAINSNSVADNHSDAERNRQAIAGIVVWVTETPSGGHILSINSSDGKYWSAYVRAKVTTSIPHKGASVTCVGRETGRGAITIDRAEDIDVVQLPRQGSHHQIAKPSETADANTLIVPDRSFGLIKLGEPLPPQIYRVLGNAGGSMPTSAWGSGVVAWGDRGGEDNGLIVRTSDGETPANVVALYYQNAEPGWPRFHTAEGVTLGSSEEEVRRAFPHAQKELGEFDYWLMVSKTTGFGIQNGKVVEISLVKAHASR